MKELAPQTPEGAYERPSYKFSFKQTQELQASLHAWPLRPPQSCMPCTCQYSILILSEVWLELKYEVGMQAESGRYVLYVGNACPWYGTAQVDLYLQLDATVTAG